MGNVSYVLLFSSSSRACRLLDWTAWPYGGYRRSKLEIGSGQVMCVVPLSEDATPKFLKGGFYEAQQQEDLDRWDKCFLGNIWNTMCLL